MAPARRKSAPRPSKRHRRRRVVLLVGAPAALLIVLAVVLAWRLRDRHPPLPPPLPTPAAGGPVEPAPRPTHLVNFSDGCVSAECHAGMATAPKLHEPVAELACDACHQGDNGGHVYPLVVGPDRLCLKCHDTGTTEPVQHRAMSAEGCLACHDPHTSDNAQLLNAGSVRETCARCHPTTEGSTRHEPYAEGNCGACHEPHASAEPGLLRGGVGSRHCAMCHSATDEEMRSALHTHAGVEGECLACHGPHATKHKGLLVADIGTTCKGCHAEVSKAVEGSVVSHDAVLKGDQCLACHRPHDSNLDKMLRGDERTVCLGCHKDQLKARDGRTIPAMGALLTASPVIHGPVAAGNCGACHSIHGANHERLLRQLNPSVLYGSFDIQNYALCFGCHSQELVLTDSAEATGFREGTLNLHRKHMTYGGKARSCASCHAVHGSVQPRLIADAAPYEGSDWLVPIDFKLTPDGGSCASSCHETLTYSRSAPTPELEAPPEGEPTPPSDPADQEGGAP
ncbi:MAG: hypothetical protein IPJ41_16255 [Phycisphaerales bacterium]|nr:hypothetical protein [Phycisphaerales bacterium]